MRTAGIVAFLFVAATYAQTPTPPMPAAMQQHITDYLKLRHTALDGQPSVASAAKHGDLMDTQNQAAAGLRQARASAHQGDIFSPDAANGFKSLIAAAMRGKDNARIRASLKNSEPVRTPLRVNDNFPEGVPLQSTPPTLLMNLPRLPQELDYRIVGNALVLRDSTANIVVDFLPDAFSGI